MPQPNSSRVITRERYDAVLFDLDGVITDTASLHAAAWKQMFDDYLQRRATQRREVFRPFDIATDYRLYVDGKPRFDGVRDFLTSRGIQLPEGNRDDPPQAETVCGLGNRKNDLQAAGLDGVFDVQVDGNMLEEQHLAGKPAPDTFLTAAKLLAVEPARGRHRGCHLGVQAGAAGNFGLVIGVARKGNAEELKHHGAHLAVNDLAELVD